jgi:hypothetical protein
MCADRLTDRRAARGQALVELLVAMLALVPLYFGIAWVAKVLDARQATIAAARALAFECTVRLEACADVAAHPVLAAETRRRFFAAHRFGLRSDDAPRGAVAPGDGNAMWTDRLGAPLLERWDDVSVDVVPARFDSPLAFAGGLGDGAFPDAVGVLSDLAGPGRFGLAIDGGLVEARVGVRLARSRPADGWIDRLVAMPITTRASLTVLTDAWNASGPYGEAPDSVETRVAEGARLPVIETAIEAGWLPVRGLLSVAAALGFESSAGLLRWHEIDVDLVPPDRIAPLPDTPAGAPAARSTDDRP